MSKLPESFLRQMTAILENDVTHFVQELKTTPPISLRKNSKKLKTWKENFDKVKWNTEKGIYLNERPSFTLDPIFHSGVYYVQEASSMFVEWAFSQVSDTFEVSDALNVLDLCAAPGGKSTLLADMISENSLSRESSSIEL